MRPKLEPAIWSLDTGHIGMYGRVDVHKVAWLGGHTADRKTKFSHTDGLPYFHTSGVPHALLLPTWTLVRLVY